MAPLLDAWLPQGSAAGLRCKRQGDKMKPPPTTGGQQALDGGSSVLRYLSRSLTTQEDNLAGD